MITPQTSFVVQATDLKDVAGYFGAKIKRSTGYELPVNTIAAENSIVLSIDNQLPLNEEGYVLEVMPVAKADTTPTVANKFRKNRFINSISYFNK